MSSDKQRRVLGKGLSALLPNRPATSAGTLPMRGTETATATAASPSAALAPSQLPIDSIEPNPVQPRIVFDPERLQELAASIRVNGIIQPLVVRLHEGRYQLVAGERRWRAAKLAGLNAVPVVIQEVADPQLLEVALIENIQREDLNPIETAQAYDRLARELGLSQEDIGHRTGKDRTSIANTIRLLKLPEEVQVLLAERRLSMGHARAILGLPTAEQQVEVAEKTAAQGLSVRQIEALVQDLTSERVPGGPGSSKKEKHQDPNVKAAVEELERALCTRVRIVELSDQRGRIEIEYYSQSDLDRIYQQVVGQG
jgi:ParB family transcriptional regulator, chromosome partitioning protein